LDVRPNVLLRTPMAMRVPLRWIAILFDRIKANLAATGGVYRASDALKMLLAGADVTMLCSVLLRQGIDQIEVIERDLVIWMEAHEYLSVQQLRGSLSQKNCANPSAFERAQYTKALASYLIKND
jgi:dihydroorotate dehydrogenase (fumarate)